MPQSEENVEVGKIGRMDVTSIFLDNLFDLPEGHKITHIVRHPYKANKFIFYVEGPMMKEVNNGSIIPEMTIEYENDHGYTRFKKFRFYDEETRND